MKVIVPVMWYVYLFPRIRNVFEKFHHHMRNIFKSTQVNVILRNSQDVSTYKVIMATHLFAHIHIATLCSRYQFFTKGMSWAHLI